MAGIPVYSIQGRNGGWRLAGGGRTDLTGLSAAEARALFLVAGPSSAATPQLKAALRKLVRALPEPLRADAEAASGAVHVDPSTWDQAAGERRPPPVHLDALQDAVVAGRQVVVDYVARDGASSSRTVDPLGIAAKGSVWYLVAGTADGQRTFRIDRVTAVQVLPTPVERPTGFDLASAWRSVTEDVQHQRTLGARRRVGAAVGAHRVPLGVGRALRRRTGPPGRSGGGGDPRPQRRVAGRGGRRARARWSRSTPPTPSASGSLNWPTELTGLYTR